MRHGVAQKIKLLALDKQSEIVTHPYTAAAFSMASGGYFFGKSINISLTSDGYQILRRSRRKLARQNESIAY